MSSTQELRKSLEFGDLPPEIRLQIWRFAIEPRLLRFGFVSHNQVHPVERQPLHQSLIFAITNHESFSVFKQNYSQYIYKNSKGKNLYINKSIDTLWLDHGLIELENLLYNMDLYGLRYLCLTACLYSVGAKWPLKRMRFLSSLKLITVRSLGVARSPDLMFPSLRNRYDRGIVLTLERLSRELGMEGTAVYDGPKVVAVLMAGESMLGSDNSEILEQSEILYSDPSEETWEIIEDAWRGDKDWVGRDRAVQEDWLIFEIVGRKPRHLQQ